MRRTLFRTYYSLTKPGIVYGNILSVVAGYLFASKLHLNPRLFGATVGGTALVIASACVYNNYIDRKIDQKMARTKKRALVSGQVSARSAIIYATVLGMLGFTMLILYTKGLVVLVGAAAFADYVVLYGIAKRRTVYGTIVGSVSGSAPLVAGYVAVTNRLDAGALLLFLIMTCWQMPHFYAIAMYRFNDYKAAGLPVLPVARGMRTAKVHIVAYVAAFMLANIALTTSGYAGYSFVVVMTLLGLWWLVRGLRGFRALDDAAWARGMFLFSLLVVLGLSGMLAVGSALP